MKGLIGYIFLMLLLVIAFCGAFLFPDSPQKTEYDICLEKGGVPITNWNNSKIKDCKFK